MSNLSHIKGKIKSVSVTTRITHALEIISTTQQYLYKELQAGSISYLQGIYGIFFELFNDPEHDIRETNKRFISYEGGKKELWLLIGTDIGMCGDMNEKVSNYIFDHFDTKGDAMIVMGNRLSSSIENRLSKYILLKAKSELKIKDAFNSVRSMSKQIFDLFMRGNYQKLTMIYVKDPKHGIIDKINLLPFRENYFSGKKQIYNRR